MGGELNDAVQMIQRLRHRCLGLRRRFRYFWVARGVALGLDCSCPVSQGTPQWGLGPSEEATVSLGTGRVGMEWVMVVGRVGGDTHTRKLG